MVPESPSGKSDQHEALDQLREYLSDSIPPMIFAQSLDVMLRLPPRNVAAKIFGWVTSQQRGDQPLPTADFLFHAAKKLFLLGELELVPADRIKAYLDVLKPILLAGCPPEDHATLAADLDLLEESVSMSNAAIDVVHRPAGTGEIRADRRRMTSSGGGEGISHVTAESLHRMNLLLQRLEALPAVPAPEAGTIAPKQAIAAEVVTQAASGATNPEQLESSLGELERRGVAAGKDVLRLLGQALPNWAAPLDDSATGSDAPQAAVRAMRQVITLSKDGSERSQRFGELVTTAVDEFNTGSLGRAVTLVDLAKRMDKKQEVDRETVHRVRDREYARLDFKQLRRFAENEDAHHLFRRFTTFFPQLTPSELLPQLELEENRERRRLLLAILNAHGAVTREAAMAALKDSVSGDASHPWFFDRNLVYLLRSTERPEGASIDEEIDVLIPLSELNGPIQMVREAMTTLGQIQHERAIATLSARVSEMEEALTGDRELPHDEDELLALLDTTVAMLARSESPEARRCLVIHGLNRLPKLGDTLARLARLSGQDLSGEPDLVDRLVQSLRSELPRKVLGVTVKSNRRSRNAELLIRSLSGTDTQAVREVLEDVSEGYRGQSVGDAANRALARLRPAPKTEESKAEVATLSGDLALFGVPGILQNLSDSRLTGVLSVFDETGTPAATITMDGGMAHDLYAGPLVGEEALYQLLEHPAAGRFEFQQREEGSVATASKKPARPIPAMLFEGIRRYDEFNRAVALVPDASRYQATDKRPTNADDEHDADFVRTVWQRAAAGSTAVELEAEIPVDSYRIRRLFEHWVSEGSLVQRSEAQPPQAPPAQPTG